MRRLGRFGTARRRSLPAPGCQDHLARQVCAKSNQVLSAAAPDCFIFCHSTPQACIRAREAGGKVLGCSNCTRSGTSAGVAGGVRAGGFAAPRSLSAGSPGRCGGRGTETGGFIFDTAPAVQAGQRAGRAAANASQPRARTDAIPPRERRAMAHLTLFMTLFTRKASSCRVPLVQSAGRREPWLSAAAARAGNRARLNAT
jgi:hypothetical protein